MKVLFISNLRYLVYGILSVVCCVMANLGYAESQMERLDSEDFDEVYLSSKFELPMTRKIYIEDPTVEFSKSWMTKFSASTTEKYRSSTIKKYGKVFKKILKENLENRGWKVVSSKKNDAVHLVPEIKDLDIFSPDLKIYQQAIILKNVGNAKVSMDFKTPDGKVFMHIADFQATPDTVGMITTDRGYTLRYYKVVMTVWANNAAAYVEGVMRTIEQQIKK